MSVFKSEDSNSKLNAARYKEIMSVLTKNGLGFLFVRTALSSNPEKELLRAEQSGMGPSLGERLRLSCEQLGPTFVKIGQILSTRTDIVPEAVAADLAKLQDDVSPFSFEEARHEIETQLQDSIENIFADFDTTPIAAASMSQVYSAHLHSGRHVAVKVQRPNITESVMTDLEVLTQIARFVDKHTKYGRLYDFEGMVSELRKVMEREINFVSEGENLDRFRDNLSRNHDVTAPKVIWIYTTRKVLTMDFVEGVKINNIKALNEMGADKHHLAKAFVQSLIDQILIYGFFHADPHPGNVMVVDEGTRIEFIDLGMVGMLTPRFRRQLTSFVLGIATQNTRKIAAAIMNMDVAGANVNQYHFSKALNNLLDEYLYVPLSDVNIAQVFASVFDLAAQFHMKIPRDLTMVGKCLGTAQGVIEELDPHLSILTVAEETVQRVLLEHFTSADFRTDILTTALDTNDLLKSLPAFLLNMFRKAEDNDFAIDLKLDKLKVFEESLDRMANRISFTVVLLAICIIMAGVIIATGFWEPVAGETLVDLSIAVLTIGLALCCIIVGGLIFSIVYSNIKRKK